MTGASMKIAVASQNYRTITPHAGKTRRWIVFDASDPAAPVEIERLDLPRDMSLHEWKGRNDSHPLYAMHTLLVGSCGAGFVQRLGARGIRVSVPEVADPVEAVRAYLSSGAATRPLDEVIASAARGAAHDHHH